MVVCLALGQWVNVAFGSCAISLTMTGHQRDVMIASTVTAAATIVGFYLVAPYGTLAVAGVVSASLVLYNLIVTLTARRRLGISDLDDAVAGRVPALRERAPRALGRPA